jgi:ABC-2 type transport system permease protein
MSRHDPLLPNTAIVARREYADRVNSRLFHLSTLLLAALAVLVAFMPLIAKLADRGVTTSIAVVSNDPSLESRATGLLDGILNSGASADQLPFEILGRQDVGAAVADVNDGLIGAAMVIERTPSGGLAFDFHAGDAVGDDKLAVLSTAMFGIAFLDYVAQNPGSAFNTPAIDVLRASGPGGGGQSVSSSDFASRRIVAIVLIFLIFITLVIYGMWVAAGVVNEKTSRVMELMISAASARQLVVGKVVGIGLAGLTQAALVLVPAIAVLIVEDRIAVAVLGPTGSVAPSLSGLSLGLLAVFVGYFVLGFVLYALIYAAAGSLVSRADDLQMLALPLSAVAIGGYLTAIVALTGGVSGIVRIASFVPFWSPFVMLTRVAVGRATLAEVVVSFAILVATIAVTYVVAIRVYAAGVLLYGQKPGLRMIASAVVGPR